MKNILIPPMDLIIILVAISLWQVMKGSGKWSRGIAAVASVLLLALSLPVVSVGLMMPLQKAPALIHPNASDAQAIVVLGCDIYEDAPEYGHNDLLGCGLERTRYAAKVYHETHLPVVTSGAGVDGVLANSVAEVMKNVLEQDMNTPVRWVEAKSRTTMEEASEIKSILLPIGISRIFLVTHTYHMPRSQYIFEKSGFVVVPAPTGFYKNTISLQSFIPSIAALDVSATALHEWVGLLWYHLKS